MDQDSSPQPSLPLPGGTVYQPPIIVSAFEKWSRWAIIGALLIVLLFQLWGLIYDDRTITELQKNRAVDCRALVVAGVELEESGPCYEAAVRRYYDPKTGESR